MRIRPGASSGRSRKLVARLLEGRLLYLADYRVIIIIIRTAETRDKRLTVSSATSITLFPSVGELLVLRLHKDVGLLFRVAYQ
jgi:hypothetical protein